MRGKFIVIEGGDGAGKDTQIELLKGVVSSEQYLFVRDPGSTDIGEQLRAIVLHDTRVAKTTELLTYLAARAQLVDEKIRPALESGVHVIAHRFDLSTIAYQIYGRERQTLLPFLKNLSDFALGDARPDVMIFLDIDPAEGLRRARQVGEPDRLEAEKLSFHERVREGYLAHIADYKEHHTIDATKSIADIHADIRNILGV